MDTQDASREYTTNVLTAVREQHRWQTLNYKCPDEQMSGHGWATETSAERQKDPFSTCSGGETFFVLLQSNARNMNSRVKDQQVS